VSGLRAMGLALIVLSAIGMPRPVGAYNETDSGLRVFPYAGRPGSTFYLSGHGLNPNTRLFILFACPNFQRANGNLRIIDPKHGPKTDGKGEFTGWKMTAPRLINGASSGCTVYAQDGTLQFYGPEQPASYYILGPSDPMLPCYKHICVTVDPTPRRVKPGKTENVDVQAWAGALADVTVTYPGHAPVVQTVKLDWNGSGRIRVPVPKKVPNLSPIRITVHCHLRRATGDGKAAFTVIH
jgi:hypothetical protein